MRWEKGESWEAPMWGQPGGDPLSHPSSPGEKGSPWQGWALLLWLLAFLGSASDHLVTCPLDFRLDLREDSPRAESPIKKSP